MSDARAAGILLHPTSLPGPYGIGEIGDAALAFVDWLDQAGCRLWQILPLVPGESPYATWASLAANPLLLDLRQLAADGLLDPAELRSPPATSPDRVDRAAVRAWRAPLLARAADRLVAGAPGDIAAFRDAAPWAAEAARFAAIKGLHAGLPWWEWPGPLRDREPGALAAVPDAPVQGQLALQLLFERQWERVRARCRERRIEIVGDLPIYVSWDSADVWATPGAFRLDAAGHPLAVSGVPPDYFSKTGQLWGNPLYDWDAMAADGHAWWVARMRRLIEQVDRFRIDHFRGFAAFWEVPAGAADAREGRWVSGPGRALFDDLRAALGALPIIAEDLGVIDADVEALRDDLGFPGMRVLQFAFGEGADHPFLPHNHPPQSVVYTGTHDNDTTVGWWRTAPEAVQSHVQRYLAVHGGDIAWDLIRAALRSTAETAIVPMQDLLSLGSDARMNVPGVADGNWGWRVRREALNDGVAGRMRDLCELYGRI